jgi:putative methyltransferase
MSMQESSKDNISKLENKLQVVFHEYNILSNGAVYLPLVSGCLQTNAQTDSVITENYNFEPFIFYRDNPDKIMKKLDKPAVSAFSVSMWNANLNLEIAKRTKELFPDSLVVFGGPHVPLDTKEFFDKNPFVDVTVRSDGEQTFNDILKRFLETGQKKDFRDVLGISYKSLDGKVHLNQDRKLERDLDIYPSPYVDEGPFDELLKRSDINFHAILETNRGCPFPCSFCFWGQGVLQSKMRYFSIERVAQAVDWMGKNKIEYVYGADANFGMFKRDIEMAQVIVDAKQKNGYPERFRVCYGKNKPDFVFEASKVLSKADMTKGVTLSRQSNNKETLKNIRRENISLAAYDELQKRYAQEGISTYTEMILGLPGETYDSFLNGLEEVLEGSRVGQLFVYQCQVLPNTHLIDPNYKKEHGIVTKAFPLQEPHSVAREKDSVEETEEIIIYTDSMPAEDWRKSSVNAWVTQTMHPLQAGYHISNYLWAEHGIRYVDFYEHIAQKKMDSKISPLISEEINYLHYLAEKIQEGNTDTQVVPEFGNVSWKPEEASYLKFVRSSSNFYSELFEITKDFLNNNNKKFDEVEMKEIFKYQELLVPRYPNPGQTNFSFEYNIPEYMDNFFEVNRPKITKNKQTLKIVGGKDFGDDKERYARETVLWGRRSNKILYDSDWS